MSVSFPGREGSAPYVSPISPYISRLARIGLAVDDVGGGEVHDEHGIQHLVVDRVKRLLIGLGSGSGSGSGLGMGSGLG